MRKNKHLQNENIEILVSNVTSTLPHDHSFLELAYVLQGNAVHVIGNKTMAIQAGHYFIVDYNTVHSYQSVDGRPLTIVNCLFNPQLIDNSLTYCRSFSTLLKHYLIKIDAGSLRLDPSNSLFFDEDGEIRRHLMTLIEEYGARRLGFTELMRSTLIEIIIRTMRKIADENAPRDVIQYLSDYVAHNYVDPLPLSVLAKRKGYSLPHLSARFKHEMGIGYRDYLLRVRMEEACRLLANTDKKILEIAANVGYTDVNSFYANFRRVLGRSPTEFRKELRDGH